MKQRKFASLFLTLALILSLLAGFRAANQEGTYDFKSVGIGAVLIPTDFL